MSSNRDDNDVIKHEVYDSNVNMGVEGFIEDDSEDDLYGDLNNLAQNSEIQRLNEELMMKDTVISNLQSEIQQMKVQMNLLLEEKLTVEKNMVALYNTAIRELKRKDRELSEWKEKQNK
jgi:hypothetical protein